MNAAKPRLTLDENHIYRLDGRVIPGVTEILKDVGLSNHFNRDDWYLERGRAVHLAIQYCLEGDLKESSVAPAIKGYLNTFKRFWDEKKPKLLGSEKMVYDPIRWYAGTLDLRVQLPGGESLIDIKTGTPQPADAWQTAGYAHAVYKSGARYILRQGLYLRADGSYRIKNFTDHADFDVFLSACNVFHAKRRVQ